MKKNKSLILLGNTIRTIRTQRGWSQEELGYLAGLDRTYIGGIERGERNVAVLNLLKIASTLGVSPSELFSEFGKKP